MTKPDWYVPCHRQTRIFTNPVLGSPDIEEAKKICAECPLIKQCAEQALHSGSSLDGHYTRPANGVIQAGVYCTGDHWTANQLATIAGVQIPQYHDHIERNTPNATCRHCGKPMGSWTRHPESLMPGQVMHYARGYCTNCRVPYKASLAKTGSQSQRKPSQPSRPIWAQCKSSRGSKHRSTARQKPQNPNQLSIF